MDFWDYSTLMGLQEAQYRDHLSERMTSDKSRPLPPCLCFGDAGEQVPYPVTVEVQRGSDLSLRSWIGSDGGAARGAVF